MKNIIAIAAFSILFTACSKAPATAPQAQELKDLPICSDLEKAGKTYTYGKDCRIKTYQEHLKDNQ